MELEFGLVFRCRLGLGFGSGPGHVCWNETWDGHSNLDSEPRCIGVDLSSAIGPGFLGPSELGFGTNPRILEAELSQVCSPVEMTRKH